MSEPKHGESVDRSEEWEFLRQAHLVAAAARPPSSAGGVHHLALLSSDVERTIDFYQGVLEFPLTELFENRDYLGSTHFFFDVGNGNASVFRLSRVEPRPIRGGFGTDASSRHLRYS